MNSVRQPLLPTATSAMMATEDRDTLVCLIYAYWAGKGFWVQVVRHVADLVIAAFLLVTFWVLAGGALDYRALWARIEHPECPDGTVNAASMARTDCYGNRPLDLARLCEVGWGLGVVMLAAGLAWLVALAIYVTDIGALWGIRNYYRDDLHLSDAEIQHMPWFAVVSRLSDVENIPVLEITQRICREKDHLTALCNQRVLRPEVRGVTTLPLQLSQNILFAIRWHWSTPATPELMAQRFKLLAGLNAVAAPVLLVFRVMLVAFRHVEEWRRNPRTLATRQWSSWARWQLRHYCELDHVLDARLRKAHGPATAYVGMFRSELVVVVAWAASVLCGGFLVINVALALVYDEPYLTLELTDGRTVAFWMSIAAFGLAAATSVIPGEGDVYEPATKLREVERYTQFFPPSWHDAETLPTTRAEFAELFELRLTALMHELLAAVTTPYVLGVVLPAQAGAIVAHLDANRVTTDTLGDICKYSMLRHADTSNNTHLQNSIVNYISQHPDNDDDNNSVASVEL